MKTHLLKLLLFIVSLSFPAILFAQETFDNTNNPREWYYNNLESATAGDAATYMPGAGSTRNSSNASITITSASSLNNSKSYSTAALSSVGYIRWNFFGTGASSVNLNTTNWEWEFDYKNAGNFSSADPNPTTVVNSWKYWLITSVYNGDNTLGTYVTQIGTNFYLRTKTGVNSNEYFDNAVIAMPLNNHTYQVRILRNTNGYFYIYLLDRTTGVTTATDPNNPINVGKTYSTYTYSYLEASSAAADRFQWDNFNFYRPKLEFLPISGNGVSTSIYPGIVNAIPYAVNVNVRGDIYIGRLRFPTTTNSQALFADNSGALYKTSTLPLSIGTSTSLVTNIGMYDTGTAQFTVPTSEYYYSAGNAANGSPINVTNYFLVAQGRNPFYGGYPSSISFSVSNTGDDTYQPFYGVTGPYYSAQANSSSSTTPTAATAPTAPTVTTATQTNVAPTSATVGGSITSIGSANVTDYGVVYSLSSTNPTTANSKFQIGTSATGATNFSSSLTGLTANATYYVRAYAINSAGTSYGSAITFTTPAAAVVPSTPIDINAATNTIPENSAAGTLTNVTAYVYDPNLTSNGTNLALNKPVTVTSLENGAQFPGTAAVDGNTGTRWSSAFSDPQSLTVDLGAVYDIGRVKITWENAYGKDYQIQVSTDGSTYTMLKNIVGNSTLINDHTGLSKVDRSSLARYIRIYGTARGTGFGYSIIELEVYRSGVNYSLSDNAGNRFTIDQGTGVITAGSVATDYETATSHNVTVVATTASGTSSQTFNIAVSDVNDNTPVITSTNIASISEGTTAVKTITATDADGTSPNNTIAAYAISGGTNASLFTINAATGALSFITAPVYSTSGSNTYVVNVTAKDGGTPALISTAQAITVTVTRSTFDSYAYRMPITLQSQGIGMSGNLTNFPVLVSVQNNADLAVTAGICTNKIQYPAGPNYDIAFVDAAGNELNYQIEKYDASTGTLLAWVKMPVLYSAANTTLYLYFGRAVAPTNHTTAFANATWSNVTATPTTYQAVWHFNEVPSTTTSAVLDATGSGDNLIASRTQVAQNTGSIIQNGITLNGGTLSKSAATGLAALNTSFTMSSWVYYTAYPNYADNVMVLQDGGSYIQMAFRGTTNSSVSANLGGGGIVVSSNLTPAANAWHHIVYSYNGTTNSIYVDGALANTSTNGTNTGTPNTIVFGSYAIGNVENFTGTVDEARLINTTLSADWVKAEYANQRAPLTFCVAGATTTDATNVLTIPGGVVYTYNGTTYTPNVAGVSATPSFNGKESFILSGNTTLGGNYSAYAITVNNGVTFNLNGQTLNVACNVVNNGTISSVSDNSTLNFNGTTAAQTFTAGATTNVATTGKLTVNNTSSTSPGLTVKGGPFNITSLLTITSGNLTVDNASNGTLTLKSTATQTANVAVIPAAYSVTGNVRVERYFTGGNANSRGYRLLSSPVSVSAASKILPNLLYLKDNAYLTGTGGPTNGFDVAGNPTLYFYRENLAPSYLSFLTSNFRGVKTINTGSSFTMDNETPSYTLPAGNGFLFFFRGNRATNSTTNTAALANTATFVSSGYLNQGDVTVTHWYTSGNLQYNVITGNQNVRGFNLVGNPYASSIDWDGAGIITSSSVSSTIWVYNPQRKIYATYIKGSGGVGTNFNGGAANIIPSGQGFMVRATSNSPVPSVKFTEAAKVATQVASANLLMSTGGATSTTQPLQYMRLELSKDSLNREDALVFFKGTSKDVYVNNEDAEYLRGNNTLTMSTLSSDRKDVAINSIPYPKTNKTIIPVNSNISVSGLYQINLTEAKNIPDLYEVYLIDMLKKDSLDILRNKTYNFNAVAGDSTTFGSKRFKLVIRQKASMALRLLDFNASKVSGGVQLDWTTENERDYTNFTVERSTDGGKTFDVIGGFASTDKGNYFLIDKNPVNGLNQYRLKQDDVNGAISYSKIVNLMYSKTAGSSVAVNNVAVFPNPATTTINVGITEQANSPVYAIRITDGLGMVVRSVTITQTTWQTNISGLLPGTYFVQVTNNTTKAIVGNGKFIKQ